jgi:hypothetical protein
VSERHLSALDLDALLVRALSPEERARLEAHLAGCAACQAERKARDERGVAFARSVLPRGLDRLHARPQVPARRWLLGAAPAAALAVALLWQGRGPARPSLGIKGPPTLRLVVQRDGAIFEIADGAPLRPRDAVRFVVSPPPIRCGTCEGPVEGPAYLLIASIDGSGHANVYFPFRGEESVRIDPTRPVEAPSDSSIMLDDAPGPERVFALWSAAPLSSERIRPLLEARGRDGPEAIRQIPTLDVPDTLQASLFFEKTGRLP